MPDLNPYVGFYANWFYEHYGMPSNAKALDMWNDKLFYGRVDEHQNAVYMTDDLLENKIKQLDVAGSTNLYAVNFVSDAFTDLRDFVRRANATGKIPSNSIYANLKVARGYEYFGKLWSNHLAQFYDIFLNYLMIGDLKSRVGNFDDFMVYFMKFMEYFGSSIPITKTSYIKSQYCTPMVTGLILELQISDHNDNGTREIYINDPGFDFFEKAARKHGFYIAKHAPWRLIADITSFGMQSYMSPTATKTLGKDGKLKAYLKDNMELLGRPNYHLKYKPGTASNLFSGKRYYLKSYLTDITELKTNIMNMYNTFVEQFPVQVTTTTCKTAKRTVSAGSGQVGSSAYSKEFKDREKTNMFIIDKKHNEYFWLKTYKSLLFYENDIKISTRRKKNLDRTCQLYYDKLGYEKTLEFINDYVKKVKGLTVDPGYCQTYTFCKEDEKKAKQLVAGNVKIVKDSTIFPSPVSPVPTGDSDSGDGGY
jgi:hypothetical protein|tara:strand:+ start:91 stop:1527 length:1437 start_codon:yes stop_codon:yes gene_type:complete